MRRLPRIVLVSAIVAPLLAAAPSAPRAVATTPAATSAAQTASSTTTTADDGQPLIIVLDISGSMDDPDGSGGVKLASAKAAVERAVRARGNGSVVGVWAFPDEASCSTGGFVVPPETLGSSSNSPNALSDSETSVIAKVDALTTRDGGTPIGGALRDAAASLTLRGFTSATMLLVTDGLNNCDPDPCAEAKAVEQSGFDLTVDSIGFRTDTDADEDLNCIAKATGGSFTSADDGTALEKTLAGLAVPHLTMQVDYPTTVEAGSSPQVTVVVHNPSSNEATDVHANLTFQRTASRSIMPAVVPPTSPLGNIPAGESHTVVWTLTTATGDAGGTGDFTATVWGDDASAAQETGHFAVTDQQVSPDGRLFKNLDKYPLVILGDSFSSGEGSGDYLKATNSALATCHRSDNTYLADRMDAATVKIIACSGAVIENYAGDQTDDDGVRARSQQYQLQHLGAAPGAVVLTFGGNDIGFADIIAECVEAAGVRDANEALGSEFPQPNCSATTAEGQERLKDIADLQWTLLTLYESVWRDANSPQFVADRNGAYAPVIVSTYPEEFWQARYGTCSAAFDSTGVEYANELASGLMASANAAAERAAARGYEVYFAPTPLTAFQPDHTYCASDSATDVRRILTPHPDLDLHSSTAAWDSLLSLGESQESMHPNARGYSDITNALIAWQAAVQRFGPSDAAKQQAKSSPSPISSVLTTPLQPLTPEQKLGPLATVSMSLGASTLLSASGFSPGTSVTFTLHSAPMVLGSAIADKHGIALLRTTVPTTARLGKHEVQADGVDSHGRFRLVSAPAVVDEGTPLWVGLALGLAALLVAIAAIVTCVFAWRGRRRPRSLTPEPPDPA